MIKAFYQNDITNRLAAIITYGLNEGFSYKSIEEHFVASSFVNALENNQYDIESKIEEVVESAYKVKLHKTAEISFKGLFLAESYFRLFLFYNRSFEYLFLYWPISMFVEKYGVYHEMDFSSLRDDFESAIKKTTLLRKLCISSKIKTSELAKLTGLNKNTLDKYSWNNKYLDKATADTIYKLAKLFGVKENLFITNLGIYLDQSAYLFDKFNQKYRNYLGFYFANFFDNRINEKDFVYDADNKLFVSKKDDTKIIILAGGQSLDTNIKYDSNTFVVFFSGAIFDGEISFNSFKDIKCLDIIVITQEFVYIVKKGIKKEITDTINRSLIIRAKKAIS